MILSQTKVGLLYGHYKPLLLMITNWYHTVYVGLTKVNCFLHVHLEISLIGLLV